MTTNAPARPEQASRKSSFVDFPLGNLHGQSDGGFETSVINDFSDPPAAACVTQARKLGALISSLTGEGFSHFNRLNDDIKERMLWLMRDLCNEVVVLGELASEHAAKVMQEAHHG
ncbi:hypothetical protein [Paraburkholderia azotifigens]|uniref:hypothetical protein n=1 Tax=Paraburkholderia azotifigens TaxID=2057004 RepID=UPI0038BDC203